MIPCQRESLILDILEKRGVITVAEIHTYCGCSKETARRDLRRLEEKGLVIRTHGGAKQKQAPLHSGRLGLGSVMEARIALLKRADALIMTARETAASQLLVNHAREVNVPVIAEGTDCPGATTTVIVDNYKAGVDLGRWAARYAHRHLGNHVVILDVSYSASNTEARSEGFMKGFNSLYSQEHTFFRVNGQGLREIAQQATADALAINPEVNIIFAVNDDSALGALDAYKAAGLDDSQLLIVWMGLESDEIRNLLLQDGPLKACMSLFPEIVSRLCIDAAISAHNNLPLPKQIHPPAAIVTAENLQEYYYYKEETNEWGVRLERIEHELGKNGRSFNAFGHQNRSKPAHISYIQDWSSHQYYQTFLRTIQVYARQNHIALEIIDGSQDVDLEMDRLKTAIALEAARLVKDNETIILDTGETIQSLAHALRDKKNLTVITNSLLVVIELADCPDIMLIVGGGLLRHESQSFVGHQAEDSFRQLRADKAFISATGVSMAFGISNSNVDEASVKRSILESAREVVLLADHTKIGIESLVHIAPITSVNTLVTNPQIKERDRLKIAQMGVEILLADSIQSLKAAGP